MENTQNNHHTSIPEEAIRKVLDDAYLDGWKLQSVIARTRLTEKIWEKLEVLKAAESK